MLPRPFNVWVQARVPEPVAIEIIRRLSASFNVQLTPAQLAEGACLFSVPTKGIAEARAEEILATGASYQIVDAAGMVVGQGAGRPNPAGATLLGLPSAAPPPSSRPAPLPPLAATQQPSPAQGIVEEGDGFDLDNLDADSLMTLDGQTDRGVAPSLAQPAATARPTAPPPRPAQTSEAPLELERSEPPGDHAFMPPDDDTPLELAVAPRSAPRPQAAHQPIAPRPQAAHQPIAPRPHPPAAAQPAPATPPRSTVDAPEDPLDALPPLPTGPTPRARRSAQREVQLPKFLLLGGRLRQKPRLRIIAGFILALGLGGILPTCRASSVMESRVEPALKELSRSKEYGHLLAGQRGYRSPEEITAYIGGIKRRNATYGVFMWLGCGGLLAFLWFRFT